jgi:hypothetical protein
MATTTRGIPYPDDYSDAADVPAALENLAETVDTLVTTVDTKATGAQTAAATADTKATAAASAVAAHTHNGSGSVNVAITAVTGLSGALAGKSDSGHVHSQYAAATHTHSSAELAAHTHTEYAVSAHTHTQAQSHNSPDTDTAPGSLHHTLGTGANQAAAGNHDHSGFATTGHTHNDYAATTHNHDTVYSTAGHTHSEYSATGHNHDTAYATTTHNHNTLYATTSHSHSSFNGSLSITGSYSANSMRSSGSASTSVPNVRVNTDTGEMLRTTHANSAQRFKIDITSLNGADLSEVVDYGRQGDSNGPAPVDPYAVLDLTPIRYRWEQDPARINTGFLAEDVELKFPSAVMFDESGRVEGIDVRGILACLVHIVREQQTRIDALEAGQR